MGTHTSGKRGPNCAKVRDDIGPTQTLTGFVLDFRYVAVISHNAMHRKRQISTPEGAKTPEPILIKLAMVDYIRDNTPHHNFGGRNSKWVV